MTMTRLQREANEVVDKADAALDSGNCIEINLAASSLTPRLTRILNQYTKENAWFVANKNNPKLAELAQSGMNPDLLPALQQYAAQESAVHDRVLDLGQRMEAAGTACGLVK